MKSHYLLIACAALLMTAACTQRQKDVYTISNGNVEATITRYGGRIMSLMVPDKDGVKRDIVLGFDTVPEYYPQNNQTDFGAAIGRYANRIDQGHLEIDGKTYQLPQNNFGHCLHGGPDGWQYRWYTAEKVAPDMLKLKIISLDGDSNFPGKVTAHVTYTLTRDNRLVIDYEADTDAPTIINMTNHSYFNLSGDPQNCDVLDGVLYVSASNFTPVDSTFMTTGEIAPVDGTPFDFRNAKPVGRDINGPEQQLIFAGGYDHNWVLDTKGDMDKVAVEYYSPKTGIDLKVYTTEPGIQIYSGNFLDGSVKGKGGVTYGKRTGICFETQKYPDSPNKPEWPSPRLNPGEKYESHTTYAFGIKQD